MGIQFDLFYNDCKFCDPSICEMDCDPTICTEEARRCCTTKCGSEVPTNKFDADVKLALAHRSVKDLIQSVSEVIYMHSKVDNNIFISKPTLDAGTADKLYESLSYIDECLKSVRENIKNDN